MKKNLKNCKQGPGVWYNLYSRGHASVLRTLITVGIKPDALAFRVISRATLKPPGGRIKARKSQEAGNGQ